MNANELALCTGAHVTRAAEMLPHVEAAMDEFEINTAIRQAAFLSQVGHESGGLHWLREIWGPTEQQLRYEGRHDLGNSVAGDGKRFLGRGLIQITGRHNYMVAGEALDLPLTEHPELLETLTNACRSAAWFWHTHGLNELADDDRYEAITRRINGGINGMSQRFALWEGAKEVLA